MEQRYNNLISGLVYLFTGASFLFSCNEFLDVDLPKTKITSDVVFSNDITATSAVTAIYSDMLELNSFASGSNRSITALAGISADELDSYSSIGDVVEFSQNALRPDNSLVLDLWRSMYKSIYDANAVLEGLEESDAISPKIRDQLEGEALFIRAFGHFYLTNLFGDVPIIISTDYRINSTIPKSSKANVYSQIIKDLLAAQEKLTEGYITNAERIRPNKFTASALLARVYLYTGDWTNSAAQATSIIGNGIYKLVELPNVFKKNSAETIWQMRPVDPNINTQEGYFFILESDPALNPETENALTSGFMDSFEDLDERRDSWTSSYADTSGNVWYYPFKYKVKSGSIPLSEYSTVFRLAEMYLIRSEARARMGDIENAVADLDSIRSRAGIPLLSQIAPAIGQDDLLVAIAKERRMELFAEWGHRWLDLKRTNNADAVLGSVKSQWQVYDVLYPIPQSERNKNVKLGSQNEGY